MSKSVSVSIAFIIFPFFAVCQNVGVGIISPARARLEVHGVSGAGRTTGLFGELGISLQRNIPAIGFNQYRDDSLNDNNGRYIGNGYSAVLSYVHNDPTLSTGLDLYFYPSGSANGLIPTGIRPFKLTNNGRASIMTDGNAILDVGRNTGGEGAAMFWGTNYNSHFNYSASENTYIRSGKGNNVYINDIAGGKVVFGDGATRVGVNYQNPVYPFEVRQVAGTGIRMANAPYPTQTWEWRVTGSPANFNLFHSGTLKNYFRPSDGALNLVSDRRLKTNVRLLPPILDRLLLLRPVSYEMINDNPAHIRSIGFIAQEVLPLFPQLTFVGGDKAEDMMTLEYSGFGVLAIKGVQEQEQHIVLLDKKITVAERRMLEIEKKIAGEKIQNNK